MFLRRSLLLLVAVALATCGRVDTITVRKTATTLVQGGSLVEQLVGDLGFDSFVNIDFTDSQELKNQGVSREQIDAIYLRSLSLMIVDDPPGDRDFSFIQSLRFYVESPGLERRLVASGGPFGSGSTKVELQVENIDLAPYATATTMTVSTEVSGRRPAEDTTIEAEMVFDVNVNLPGLACGG